MTFHALVIMNPSVIVNTFVIMAHSVIMNHSVNMNTFVILNAVKDLLILLSQYMSDSGHCNLL